MASSPAFASFARVLADVRRRIGQAGNARVASRGRELSRLSSRVLAKGASVHVIRWGEEDLLVGCTEQTVVVLARRDVDKMQPEAR